MLVLRTWFELLDAVGCFHRGWLNIFLSSLTALTGSALHLSGLFLECIHYSDCTFGQACPENCGRGCSSSFDEPQGAILYAHFKLHSLKLFFFLSCYSEERLHCP
jgi:hypothetical protein